MKTSNAIFRITKRDKRETIEFEAIITHADRNEAGNLYLTYQPVGGRDYAKCGKWGTCTVDDQGNPINWRTQKPSAFGCRLVRTDRVYRPAPRWYPKPGDRGYDLIH